MNQGQGEKVSKGNLLKQTTLHPIPLMLQFGGNVGFIFDEHLAFSDQILSFSKSCCSLIRELRCIRPYILILKQPVQSLPILTTLNLTTVTLPTTVLLSHK